MHKNIVYFIEEAPNSTSLNYKFKIKKYNCSTRKTSNISSNVFTASVPYADKITNKYIIYSKNGNYYKYTYKTKKTIKTKSPYGI